MLFNYIQLYCLWKSLVLENRVLKFSSSGTIYTRTWCSTSGKLHQLIRGEVCSCRALVQHVGVEFCPSKEFHGNTLLCCVMLCYVELNTPSDSWHSSCWNQLQIFSELWEKIAWSLDVDFLWLLWSYKASVKDWISQGTICLCLLLKTIASGMHALNCDVSESWA